MHTLKIHKGDTVIMLSGPDKGKSGKVARVLPRENSVLIEGLNMAKHHLKARKQGQKGQVIVRERFIDAAKVAMVCKSCGKTTRIGYTVTESNKVRICRKCKAEI